MRTEDRTCPNCRAETLPMARYCGTCGESVAGGFSATLRAQDTPSAPDSQELSLPGTPWSYRLRRLAAATLDAFVIGAVVWLCARASLGPHLAFLGLAKRSLLVLVGPVLWCLRDASGGRSPGKVVFGLAAVGSEDGRPIRPVRSVLRNALVAIPAIGPVLGLFVFAPAILRGNARHAGDRFANTVVVPEEYTTPTDR